MNNRQLYCKNWEQLRVLIKIRDGYCCTICGKKESELRTKSNKPTSLHVIHIDGDPSNNKYNPIQVSFNSVENNLASACPTCHRIFDNQHGNNKRYTIKQNHEIVDMCLTK